MANTVLVTGANGYVGNNLVKALAGRGHAVRATVRDAADPARSGHLRAIAGVEVTSLDVRDADAFVRTCAGVDTLFHVAATNRLYARSRQAEEDMIRDSVEGARSAILAAADAKVQRVVMTSSIVTLPLVSPGEPAVDEKDWRTDLAVPYFRAKVLAEQEAWRVARKRDIHLVTILPGVILGPGFLRRTASTDVIEGIMAGSMRFGAPDSNLPIVDIRDVVSAHILAAEKAASGRYVICNDSFPSMQEITKILHRLDPKIPAASRILPDFVVGMAPLFDALNARLAGVPRVVTPELVRSTRGKIYKASNAKAKRELGWRQTIAQEDTLRATMETLRVLNGSRG